MFVLHPKQTIYLYDELHTPIWLKHKVQHNQISANSFNSRDMSSLCVRFKFTTTHTTHTTHDPYKAIVRHSTSSSFDETRIAIYVYLRVKTRDEWSNAELIKSITGEWLRDSWVAIASDWSSHYISNAVFYIVYRSVKRIVILEIKNIHWQLSYTNYMCNRPLIC